MIKVMGNRGLDLDICMEIWPINRPNNCLFPAHLKMVASLIANQ